MLGNLASDIGYRLVRGVGGRHKKMEGAGAGTTLKTLARRAGVRVLDRRQVCSLVRQAVGGALANLADASPGQNEQIENESCKRFEQLLEDFRQAGALPEAVPDGSETAHRLVRYDSIAELTEAIAGAVRASLAGAGPVDMPSGRVDSLERRLDSLMHSLEQTQRAISQGGFSRGPRHAENYARPERSEMTEQHVALMKQILDENIDLRSEQENAAQIE